MPAPGYHPDYLHAYMHPQLCVDTSLKSYETALAATTRTQIENAPPILIEFPNAGSAGLSFEGKYCLPQMDDLPEEDGAPVPGGITPDETDFPSMFGLVWIEDHNALSGVRTSSVRALVTAQRIPRTLMERILFREEKVSLKGWLIPFNEPSKHDFDSNRP